MSQPRPTARVRRLIAGLRSATVAILALGAFFGLRNTSLLQALSEQGVFVTGHVTNVGEANWLGQPYVSYWYETGGQRWQATDRVDVEHRTSILTQGKFSLMILPSAPAVHSVDGIESSAIVGTRWLWGIGTALLAGLGELLAFVLGWRVRQQWQVWRSSAPVEATVVKVEDEAKSLVTHRRAAVLSYQMPGESPIEATVPVGAADEVQTGQTVDVLVDQHGAVRLASSLSLIDTESFTVPRPCHSV